MKSTKMEIPWRNKCSNSEELPSGRVPCTVSYRASYPYYTHVFVCIRITVEHIPLFIMPWPGPGVIRRNTETHFSTHYRDSDKHARRLV